MAEPDEQEDLAELAEALGPPPELNADAGSDLLASIEASIAEERGVVAWLRSRPTPLRWLFGLLGMATIVVLSGTALVRVDLAVYPMDRLLVVSGAYALMLIMALPGALRGPHEAAGPVGTRTLFLVGLVTAPLVLSLLPTAHVYHAASLAGVGDDFARRAAGCMAFGLGLAAPVLALLAIMDRSALRSVSVVLVAAAAAGITGVLALHLHCPLTDPTHILVGHGLLVAVLVPAYLLVAKLLTRRAA